MSAITHLYHLSALDFINTSGYPGMSPWTPSYTLALGSPAYTGMLDGTTAIGSALVGSYVEALAARRKCHTMSALFSGRHPIQNAIVPGGVTTMLSSTMPADYLTTSYDKYGPFNAVTARARFKTLLTEVRNFINTKYLPNTLLVATTFSTFFKAGTGVMKLLSYGEYPDTTGALAIKRGIAQGLTPRDFDQANILEYVNYSYYNYGLGETALHPFNGRTTPAYGGAGKYSWLKAPRYNYSGSIWALEVGPLARVVNTHIRGGGGNVSQQGTGVTVYSGFSNSYNVTDLVTYAVTNAVPGADANLLFSALGRHAARMLEAKYLADAMAVWEGLITNNSPAYTYVQIPRQISAGYGLAEAPRGALGHWIKIEGRKVAKYQCVVPTTWNASPKALSSSDNGPIESAISGVGVGQVPTATNAAIVNILRLIHPFDICIACAVHIVSPEGNELAKFAIDPDGKVTI